MISGHAPPSGRRAAPALVALLALTAGLAACRALPEREAPAGTWLKEREAYFAELASWRLEGRLAITDGRRGGSLRFSVEDGNQGEWRANLSTTGERWRLTVQPGGARLEAGHGGTQFGPEPEPLVAAALGFELPVSLLRDWVRGLPSPAAARASFRRNGTLSEVRYDGWRVRYLDYVLQETLLLPTSIEAERGKYRIRVRIAKWALAADTPVPVSPVKAPG